MSCSLLTIPSGPPTLPLGHRDLPWQWALLSPGGREGTLAASTGAMSDLGGSCLGYGGQSCHPALPSLQGYQVHLSWKWQSGWRLLRTLGVGRALRPVKAQEESWGSWAFVYCPHMWVAFGGSTVYVRQADIGRGSFSNASGKCHRWSWVLAPSLSCPCRGGNWSC